jgi:hypothetical protein
MGGISWRETAKNLKRSCGASGGELLEAKRLWDELEVANTQKDQITAERYMRRILVERGIISDPYVTRERDEIVIADDYIQGGERLTNTDLTLARRLLLGGKKSIERE